MVNLVKCLVDIERYQVSLQETVLDMVAHSKELVQTAEWTPKKPPLSFRGS